MNDGFESIYVGPARVRITRIPDGSDVFEVWIEEKDPLGDDYAKRYAYSGPLAHAYIQDGTAHHFRGGRMLFREDGEMQT